MTLDEFRRQMEAFRRSVDQEANAAKDSYLALDRLLQLYRSFDAHEREMADQVLVEWVLSEDENLRFDALALIREFKMSKAVPSLTALAVRLAASHSPGAPYELEKVRRLLLQLAESRQLPS